MKTIAIALLLCAGAWVTRAAAPTPALKDIVARLDRGASKFQSMSSDVERTRYTAVLNDKSTETGVVRMRKLPRGVEGVMEIAQPDKKTYAFAGKEIDIYYPQMKSVDIYNAGEKGEELENFITLGFGTPGSELEKNYSMQIAGQDTVDGKPATRLVLAPKSADAKKLIKEVDLWIPEDASHPIQEKIVEPSGDYTQVTYKNLQINPNLKEQEYKLSLPKGVKKNHPQQ